MSSNAFSRADHGGRRRIWDFHFGNKDLLFSLNYNHFNINVTVFQKIIGVCVVSCLPVKDFF